MTKIPTPLFNMINGGKHGAGNLNIQEFHIIPATSKPFSEALEIGADYVVSLDRRHLVGNPRTGDLPFAVGTPGEFLAWYRQRVVEG